VPVARLATAIRLESGSATAAGVPLVRRM
jgi:hypothetical protein